MNTTAAAALSLLNLAVPIHAQESMPVVLPLRERARVMDEWLEQRLDTVVSALMRREGIDMWVLVAREYNEDPVVETMLPATWLAARRRTVLVFSDRGAEDGVERLAVARYDVGRFFQKAWDKEAQPDQWQALADLIVSREPKAIALNLSSHFALADGLSGSQYSDLSRALPDTFMERVVPGERLALGWLETRSAEEMAVYPTICRIAHRIIAEGLSEQVIQPGVTTTADVQWWYRERIRELKLVTWFHPSVSVQRASDEGHSGSFASKPGAQVILRGDLVHVDFGITYLGLNTDTQQHAYVLRAGESAPPPGLVRGMELGNRMQDVLTGCFETGKTGNEILACALEKGRAEGLRPTIYTHPLGYHGHGAGPTIGLWDQQDGVVGKGDYPLFGDTCHSIELNVTVSVPEWGDKDVRIMLEEDAFFDGEVARYIDGRQTELLLIP
jgi:Xaa-Pro aminopeptidase